MTSPSVVLCNSFCDYLVNCILILCTDSSAKSGAPQILRHLQDITAADGQEVALFCIIVGCPMPVITWYHNSKNITGNDEYVFKYDRLTGQTYLVILDCLPDDSGMFHCVATNHFGRAVTSCALTVLEKPILADGKVTAQLLKTSGASSASRTSEHMSLTSRQTLAAAINSERKTSLQTLILRPEPVGSMVGPIASDKRSSAVLLLASGQRTNVHDSSGLLRRASDNDIANFQSSASMSPLTQQGILGNEMEWDIDLRQSKAPKVQSPVRMEPRHDAKSIQQHTPQLAVSPLSCAAPPEPPRFTVRLANQVIRDGSMAIFRVSYRGYPLPKVTWYFKQKVIELMDPDFVISTDNSKMESALWIKEVFPDDEGEYTCKVENQCGTAVTHCRLSVLCK